MTGEALTTLATMDGVYGAVVTDESGNCLADRLRPPYDPLLLSGVVKRLLLSFDALSSIGSGDVASFSAECEDGALHLRRVEGGWVVALTSPDVNATMLNLAMNVVALGLSRAVPDAETQPMRPSAPQPPPLPVTAAPLPVPLPAPRAPTAPAGARSSASLRSSTFGDAIPPDAIDRTIVQQLLGIYTDYLGPAAKLVLKQQLAALGATSRTLRRPQLGELVSSLTARIPVPERQAEFRAAVREYRERLLI